MQENTVFDPTQKAQTPFPADNGGQKPIIESDTVHIDQPQPAQQDAGTSNPPPPTPPPPADDGYYEEESFFSKLLPLALKIGIGIVIIAILFGGFLLVRGLLTKGETENVTLVYWGLWEDKATVQPLLDEFHKEYPNITVTYEKQDNKTYKDRLQTRINAGTGPDVYRFHNSWVPQVRSLLAPLPSDVVEKDAFDTIYYFVAKQDLVENGAAYGVPTSIDTLALFVNPEILQAGGITVPETWEEFGTAARSLTVKDETGKIQTAGVVMGTYDNVAHASDLASLLMLQNGVEFTEFDASKDLAIDALRFYTQYAKGEGRVWDETLDPGVLAFAKGNAAMFFGYSWDIFTIKAINPDAPLAVHPMPTLGGRRLTVASYWPVGVSSKSTYQKEAFLLLTFLAKKETQQKMYLLQSKNRLFGELYARRDLAPLLQDNALIYPFVAQAGEATSTYFASDTYDNGLNSELNAYLGNAVRATVGNTSEQSAIDTLIKGVQDVFAKYGIQ